MGLGMIYCRTNGWISSEISSCALILCMMYLRGHFGVLYVLTKIKVDPNIGQFERS